MKNNFNGWCKIFLGVPQGSIRCPLLFNIFLNDIFYFIQEAYIYNFAGDNSLYSIEDNYKEVKTILRRTLNSYKCGLSYTILNPAKCHYSTIKKDITNEYVELGKKTDFTC